MGRIVRSFGTVMPGPILDARVEARRLRAEASVEVEGRRAQVATLEEESRRRGYEAGYAEGRQAGLADVTALMVAARAEQERARITAREAAATLARRIAEKIIGREIDLFPHTMAELVAQAIDASRARSGVLSVRVHPEDLATLERTRPDLVARLATGIEARFVPDAEIDRFGCVVETPLGRLDARLSTQLDALERALLGVRT
jgi:flagellar biosynthesis/type III secretory pathway protein FliH